MFSLVPGASIVAFGKLITFSELSLQQCGLRTQHVFVECMNVKNPPTLRPLGTSRLNLQRCSRLQL